MDGVGHFRIDAPEQIDNAFITVNAVDGAGGRLPIRIVWLVAGANLEFLGWVERIPVNDGTLHAASFAEVP
jgi:hypothetical protein